MQKAGLYGCVLAVFCWRAIAIGYPHAAIDDPEIVSWSLAAMGLWFVGCGLWAYTRHPNRSTALFLVYTACTGIHWGGPIGFDQESQYIFLALYLLVSSIGAQCLFLNLAIQGSTEYRIGHVIRLVIYAPVLGGLVLFMVQIANPADPRILTYLMTGLSVATVFSLTGAGFWIFGWLRAASGSLIRRRRGLVVVTLLCWIPSIVTMFELFDWGGMEGLLNLSLVFEPVVLAFYFSRQSAQKT